MTPGSKHERRESDDTITFGTIMVQDGAPMSNSLISGNRTRWMVSRNRVSPRKQDVEDRINTRTVVAISEDKSVRGAGDEAGYFIHEWQALRDQARRMII